jgi:hypothetical protein
LITGKEQEKLLFSLLVSKINMSKKPGILKFFLIPIAVLFGGWGEIAHQTININMFKCLPAEMVEFKSWKDYFNNHASDADERKDIDPNETPKHSINLDSYPEFWINGNISQDLDSLIMLHGSRFVYDEGILPWAIITTYNSLKNYLINRDWKSAKQVAVDLGHYVGDCYMPFHTQKDRDYDKLHQRFENDFIDLYSSQIDFKYSPAVNIPNVEDLIFNTLYKNFTYSDSIIIADIYAQDYSGYKIDDIYYSTLWTRSKSFTDELFSNASNLFASLIYSAWSEAGKPPFNTTSVNGKDIENLNFNLSQNYPNPFNSTTKIRYTMPSNVKGVKSNVNLKVYDILGNEVATLVNEEKSAGNYEVEFNSGNLSSGLYFYMLRAGEFVETRSMNLIK